MLKCFNIFETFLVPCMGLHCAMFLDTFSTNSKFSNLDLLILISKSYKFVDNIFVNKKCPRLHYIIECMLA